MPNLLMAIIVYPAGERMSRHVVNIVNNKNRNATKDISGSYGILPQTTFLSGVSTYKIP